MPARARAKSATAVSLKFFSALPPFHAPLKLLSRTPACLPACPPASCTFRHTAAALTQVAARVQHFAQTDMAVSQTPTTTVAECAQDAPSTPNPEKQAPQAHSPRSVNDAAQMDVVDDGGVSCERSKTTAILDWDDTICPSTYLASLGLRVDDSASLPVPLQQQLEQLEQAVINIVKKALRFGAVVIITNAEAGWVELSGRRFLPRVVQFLEAHHIKIVSARTSFESHYPDAPSSWKVAAFSQEVSEMFPGDDELNVLVLGDSMSERDAAHALGSRMPNSRVKTVKFVERPSIDQLMRQVQLVAQSLPDLASYASSFDVDLVVSASC